jgi:hypothetical protein
VTVVEIDEVFGQITQESHVFMPGSGEHLSQISCRALAGVTSTEIKEQCAQATYRLFVDYIRDHDKEAFALLSDSYRPYQKEALASPPFNRLKRERGFINEMEAIREWTKSADLRRIIAQALAPTFERVGTQTVASCFCRGGYDASKDETSGLCERKRVWLD